MGKSNAIFTLGNGNTINNDIRNTNGPAQDPKKESSVLTIVSIIIAAGALVVEILVGWQEIISNIF